ncbi:MAG TPA: regulatory protein RecX [Bacteroidia bacterium]|nr:regulatory protein RecX [Bacteroidia bacterium]
MRSDRAGLEKIKRWCAYQERSHFETRQKLTAWGWKNEQIEEALSILISENYLNEERFARALVRGKFRLKGWGRVKLRKELMGHRISAPNINLALTEIEENEYLRTMRELAEKKRREKATASPIMLQAAIYRFLLSKGYEAELIQHHIIRNTALHES